MNEENQDKPAYERFFADPLTEQDAMREVVKEFFCGRTFLYKVILDTNSKIIGTKIVAPNGMFHTAYWKEDIPRYICYGLLVEWLYQVREALENGVQS